MTLSKKSFLAFIVLFITISAFSQDLIYSVRGEYNSSSLALDSILVENLDNGTRLLFGSLPEQPDYQINLSTGEQVGPSGIYTYRIDNHISVARNLPGNLGISVLSNRIEEAGITIYSILGQALWINHNLKLRHGNIIDVDLPGDGIYIVEIRSEFGSKAFRAAGSLLKGAIQVSINGNTISEESRLKSAYANEITDFSFSEGDSLRISAFRNGYYARPSLIILAGSESIHFPFELSTVDINGTSDAYTNISDSTFQSIEYSDPTGVVHLVLKSGGDSVVVGDVITIDLDTAGYLRKVISVSEQDGEIILETIQATMNELFVDKSFKLNTAMIEPTATLKSTSSMSEISQALTDDQGYIHPVKVILFDEDGKAFRQSAFGLKGTSDEIRQPIVHTYLDFSNTDLYGEEGDNVHFYISEGHISFNTDAVFEFDFTYEGEFTEDTKVKKGDLNVFEFYLEATAGILTKVELDMSKEWDKEYKPDKPLFHIARARAQFVVPPGVPVWIDFDINMYRALMLHADASLHADWGFEVNDTLRVGGRYTRETKELTPISEFKHHSEIYPLNLNGEINASARLELYPRVDMKLYSIFGPFVEVAPYVQGNYNAAMQAQITPDGTETFLAYNAGLDLGLDLRVGTELKVLGFQRGFGPIEIPCLNYPLWRSPSNIELLTNLPTEAESGSKHTLTLKILDLLDHPVALCPVYIEGDGVFSKYLSITDIYGEVTIDWTLGNETGEQSMIITIYDASKSVIDELTHNIITTGPSLDLIAFYPFNGNASDETGNGHDGTVHGATLTSDRFGNANSAYSFDGSNDWINSNSTFDYASRSVSIWFYSRINTGSGDNGHTIFDQDDNALSYGSVHSGINDGVLGMQAGGADGNVRFSTTVEENKWYHIVLVRSSENAKYYLNGNYIGESEVNGLGSIYTPNSNFVIGTNRTLNTHLFNGIIDDIKIYNSALSESQISEIFHEGGWNSQTPPETGTFTDSRDGNDYKWVQIGDQTWMAENLAYLTEVSPSTLESKTSKYNYVYDYNGSSVTEAKSTYNYKTYGVLYNWLAAQDVCPSGWHLPSESEFQILEATLGMSQSTILLDEWRGDNEGGMLKSTGTTLWISPNSGATNETGFSALPAGLFNNGEFSVINEFAGFWSSTSYISTAAYYRALQYDKSNIRRANYKVKNSGYSVRCVMD